MTTIGQATLETASKLKNSTDGFDKCGKVVHNVITAGNGIAKATVGTVYGPALELSKLCKGFSTISGGFNFILRLEELLCPKPKGNIYGNTAGKDFNWKFWKGAEGNVPYGWVRPTWTPEGVELNKETKEALDGLLKAKIDRNKIQSTGYYSAMRTTTTGLLTVAHATNAALFLNTLGFVNMGGAVPFLGLGVNVIYLHAGILGIADAAKKIHMSKVYVANCEKKYQKWEDRISLSLETLNAHYQTKIDNARKKISLLEDRLPNVKETEKKAIRIFNDRLKNKIQWWTHFVADFESIDPSLTGDALKEALKKTKGFGGMRNRKVKDWTKNTAIAKENAKIETTKNAINIAYQVLKIALGIIGITLSTLAILSSFGVIAPIAPLALTIMGIVTATGWAVTESVGLSEKIYGFFKSVKKIEKPSTASIRYDLGASMPSSFVKLEMKPLGALGDDTGTNTGTNTGTKTDADTQKSEEAKKQTGETNDTQLKDLNQDNAGADPVIEGGVVVEDQNGAGADPVIEEVAIEDQNGANADPVIEEIADNDQNGANADPVIEEIADNDQNDANADPVAKEEIADNDQNGANADPVAKEEIENDVTIEEVPVKEEEADQVD